MAKTQGQPAAQKPATAEHESTFLKRNAALINETARIYGLADKATPEDKAKVREDWKTALKDGDDWRIIKNHFGMCVILHGFEGRLFEAIYNSHLAKETGRFAEAMRNVARLVDFRVDKFAPFVAENLINAFYDKFGSGGTAVPAAGNLLAAMQQTELTWNHDAQTLERWVESSARRSANRAERSAMTQNAIVEALLNEDEGVGSEAEPEPDPRVELTSKLEAARVRKTQAVESEDFTAAKAAKDEIVKLEIELAVLNLPETATIETLVPVEVVTKTIVPVTAPAPTPVATAQVTTPATPTPTATAQPTPVAAPASTLNFPTRVESSKLSHKTKENLITAYAAGDPDAEKRFNTLLMTLQK